MLAGNAAETNDANVDGTSICHRCWTSDTEEQFVGGAPCTGSDTVAIPQNPQCKMIRSTIIFPTLVPPPPPPPGSERQECLTTGLETAAGTA